MKKLFLMAAVLGGFALTSNDVLADNHDGHDHKGKMMQKVDTNNDGMISKAEFMAKHEEKFMKMDVNSDGMISAEEHKAAKNKWKEKRMKKNAE